MIGQVRVAHPSIKLNGFEYFNKLEPYFLTLHYVDSADGQTADDCQLQLADRDDRFITDWMPSKGVYLDIGIIAERWYSPNAAQLTLDCGRLWIDEIEFELPQHTVSIKATSIPTSSYLKSTDETRGWENHTLRDIANQIVAEQKAAGTDITLDYRAQFNPLYSHVEQTEQSSLEFIMHRARDANLAVKLHRNLLIIFDNEEIEATPPSFAIVFGDNAPVPGLPCFRMAGGKFATRLIDTLKQATVAHVDPASGKAHYSTAIAGDADAIDDWHTNINQSTDGADEEDGGGDGGDGRATRDTPPPQGDWNADGGSATQMRLAKSTLRRHNKDQVHADIDLSIGCPLVASGQTFTLSGVGNYDGKWFLERAEHKCGPMFTTTLKARKCLVGY